MISAGYDYHAPAERSEALELLRGDRVTILAGGTWVVPELSHGTRDARVVLDLRRLGLNRVERAGGHVSVGPAATYSAVAAAEHAPALLRTMAVGITGGAQIRNQGTIGGSACYANPGSDVPAVLVALDATLVAADAEGERELPAAELFHGAFANSLGPGELLTDIRLPVEPDSFYGYEKLKLVAGSWPIVTAAAVVDGAGAIRRLVLGGAQATPVSVAVAPDADAAAVAGAATDAVTAPWSDALADGAYRRDVAGAIAKRAVAKARTNAGGTP